MARRRPPAHRTRKPLALDWRRLTLERLEDREFPGSVVLSLLPLWDGPIVPDPWAGGAESRPAARSSDRPELPTPPVAAWLSFGIPDGPALHPAVPDADRPHRGDEPSAGSAPMSPPADNRWGGGWLAFDPFGDDARRDAPTGPRAPAQANESAPGSGTAPGAGGQPPTASAGPTSGPAAGGPAASAHPDAGPAVPTDSAVPVTPGRGPTPAQPRSTPATTVPPAAPAADSPTTPAVPSGTVPVTAAPATPAGTPVAAPAVPGAAPSAGLAAPLSPQVRIGFNHENLGGWHIQVVGGTADGRGSVRPGSAVLREGNSYLVGLEQSFTVPANPAPLVFRYTELSFDTADTASMHDAFEASLVDAQGHTLVQPFAAGRDAFFNISEGTDTAVGRGSSEAGTDVRTVTLDLSGVAAGTVATVRFRLVNNDHDTNTSVRILDVLAPGVNQPPTLDPVANLTVPEDSGSRSLSLTGITAGPGESQSLTVTATSSNPALIPDPAVSYTSPNSTGTLSFTPAADANGTATVTVTVKDDGGTAGGGTDTVSRTFTVTVTPVNDAPSFTKGPDQAAPQDAPAQSVAGWATAVRAGPPNEAGQVLAFLISSDNPALFASDGQPAVSPAGTLSYRPAPGASGVAHVTARLKDDGGTADGGIDTSGPQTFTITVTATNHAPTASITGDATGVRGQPRHFAVAATDPDPGDAAAGFTFRIDWGDGSSQTILPGQPLALTHAFAATGTYTVTVTATDRGGLVSAPATRAVQITAVAVLPDVCDPTLTALYAGGTPGQDVVLFQKGAKAGEVKVTINGTTYGPFTPNGHIVAFGQGGDDGLSAGNVSLSAWFFGDGGSDTLTGGPGDDVLVGGDGNDALAGNAGRDVLLAGAGADVVTGGPGDDLLVNGTTRFDADPSALCAIEDEWTSSRGFAVRVKNLRGEPNAAFADRLNGNIFLVTGLGATVFADAAHDDLKGQDNNCWFLADVDAGPAQDSYDFGGIDVVEDVDPPGTTHVGPVAAYNFDAGSGTTLADVTGRGHDGQIAGANWSVAGGKSGGALSFDGVDDWVTIPDAADLDLTTGLTLEAWVRPAAADGWRSVLLKESAGPPAGLAYALYANGADTNRPGAFANTGGSDLSARGTAKLPVNAWAHLAATYDGVTLRLYVNGIEVGSKPVTQALRQTDNPLRIGGNAVWGEYFAGLIDDVRVYDRALSAAEVARDMATPVGPGADGAKFFVTDPSAGAAFRYGPTGVVAGGFGLAGAAADPRGVAANAAGDTLWVLDAAAKRVVVQSPGGAVRGSWAAGGLQDPQDITTDGMDVWVVDAGLRQVVRYAGAAALSSGTVSPAGAFALHADNAHPTGVVTDGQTLWVTDDVRDEVFVYSPAGTLLGRWALDPQNGDASGITRDPTGASGDLWVADRADARVYRYAGAAAVRSGALTAADSFALSAADAHPEGIADPPVTDPNDPRSWQGATVGTFAQLYYGSDTPANRQRVVDARLLDDGLFDNSRSFPTTLLATPWALGGPGVGQSLDTTGTGGYDYTRPNVSVFDAANGIDSLWIQTGNTIGDAVWDLGIPSPKAAIFNTIDHGPLPQEAIESTAYLSNDRVTWTQAVVQKVWLEGFQANLGIKWDGFVYAVGTGSTNTFRYVSIIWGGPGGLQADGDNEINGVLGLNNDFTPAALVPPTVNVLSPQNGVAFAGGSTVLVSGEARAKTVGSSITSVTVNGQPVDALDPTGNFFTRVTVAPGQTVLSIVATDSYSQTAATSLTLRGASPSAGPIDFSLFSDVSASFRGEYGRTSWNEDTDLIYADLAVRNAGGYPAGTPLLVGVRNISDPSVRVRDADGTTPDGLPYYDFSALVAGGTLAPGGLTGRRPIAFFNPNHVQFTYELVFLGQINRAPAITTVPDVEALAGRPYAYDVDAADPDGDPLTYRLTAGPAGMTIDAATGRIAWTPASAELGTRDVAVRVEDGRGGSAEQRYTLGVVAAPPNRPPVFTSVPVVSATVGAAYAYPATAADPDGDPLTFSVLSGPQGLTVNAGTGAVAWAPAAAQVGPQAVTLQVSDGRGGTATQAFTVLVGQVPGNHPPVIVSTPVTTALAGQPQVLYVANAGDNTIHRFATDGTDLGGFAARGNEPLGIALDNSGNLYVSLYLDNVIRKFSPDGTDLGVFANTGLANPAGMVFDSNGRLYVVNYNYDSGINGTRQSFVRAFSPTGADLGVVISGFPMDYFIVRDQNGNFYLDDDSVVRGVRKFSPTGSDLGLIGGGVFPNSDFAEGMVFDGVGDLLVSDPLASVIHKFSPAGAYLGLFGSAYASRGITFNSNGELLATVGSTIRKFSPTGADLGNFAATGLNQPYGLALQSASPGQTYAYLVKAIDPDNDALTYSLTSMPGGMSIVPTTGQILWNPQASDVGSHDVTVRVEDGRGGSDTQSFTIDVLGNRPPKIVTPPVTTAYSGQPYSYDVDAIDPDNDPLTYSLTTAPAGMTINPSSGLISWPVPPQSLQVQSVTHFGSTGDDYGFGVATDTAGNTYYTGFFEGTVDFDPGPGVVSLTAAGLSDVFVAKFTSAGALAWVRQAGGSETTGGLQPNLTDTGRTVAVDADGNVYVTGEFLGTADFDPGPGVVQLVSGGSLDAFVWKLNRDGNFVWARRAGSGGRDHGNDLALDGQGNVYTVGYFQGTVDFDPGPGTFPLTAAGTFDVYVSKLDRDGNFLWARRVGGGSGNFPEGSSPAVGVDGAGNVYAAGTFVGTVDFDPGANAVNLTSAGSEDAFIFKLDSGGNFLWARQVGRAGGFQSIQGLAVDSAGNAYTTGIFIGPVDFDPGPGSFMLPGEGATYDGFLLKLDPAGNFAWARQFSGSNRDQSGHEVTVDHQGAVYVVGDLGQTVSSGPGGASVTAPDGSIAIAKFDSGGTLIWAHAGGSGAEDVAVDCLGGVYTTGYFSGQADFGFSPGAFRLDSNGGYDIFMARYTQPPPCPPVTVRVEDGRGGSDTQSFTIDVSTDQPPELAGVCDQTVQAGSTLQLTLGNPGLHAGELIVGNVSSRGQLKRVDPTTGVQTLLYDQILNGPPGIPFAPNHLVLDCVGNLVTNAPVSGSDLTQFSGIRLNPADGTYTQLSLYQVLTHLPNGNYLVQERSDTGLSEYNLVTGHVRTVTDQVIAPAGIAGIALAHDSTGEPFIDAQSNVYLGIETRGVFRLNLLSGSLQQIDTVDTSQANYAVGLTIIDGRYLFLTSGGTTTGSGAQQAGWPRDGRVYRIDLVTGQKQLVVNGGLLVDPWGITVAEDGTLYVADANGIDQNGNGGQGSIVAIDPVSFAQRLISTGQFQLVSANHFRPIVSVSRFAANGALDPDGDPLTFSMTGLPAGATFDPATKTLSWTPTAQQGGRYTVTVQVSDGHGGFDRRQFQITVVGGTGTPANQPPTFTSTAPTTATVGQLLRYNAAASDADGDPLTFDLVVKPVGMSVDSATGTVVWVPTADQAGPQDVTLRVRDGRGGVALQSFTVAVGRPNAVPVITSTPTGPAVVGVAYQYPVRAQDADGDPISFSLTAGPAGMAVNPATGLLTWTPAANQVGSQHVAVTAGDGRGGATTQSFDLTVLATAPNRAPAITSTPRGSVRVGDAYRYQVAAADPDGDPLADSLTTAPAGMAVDAAGLVTWVPAAGQLGPNAVTVRVQDGRGGFATQSFTVQVVTQATNRPPAVTSTPPFAATVGRPYAYDLAAADPDGDPLAWGLDAAPAGVSIDPQRGTLRWTPAADQAGSQSVVVRVVDGQGGFATQSWSVTVRPVNVPPNITSAPPTAAAAGTAYAYAVRAADPDGDALTFRLTTAPAGMTIDPATGLIQWTPTSAQVGNQAVTVVADDGFGGTATQSYTVVVAAQAANRPPVITSAPPLAAAVGQPYPYQAAATDPDGDAVLFTLRQAPAGMTIDPATGVIAWTPTAAQAGPQAVTVAAVDPAGNAGTQSFTVAVAAANRAPTISSSPVQTVAAGLPYRYDVRAADPDGDPLTYTLDQAPAGLTIDTLGRITWAPGIPDIGTKRVAVTVADGRGASVTQTYDLAVLADTLAPRITLLLSDNPAQVRTPVTAVVSATDNVGVTALTLTVNGQPVALDGQGRATLAFPTAGPVSLRATASDAAGLTSVATTTLPVIDTSDVDAPVVSLTGPADGAVLDAPASVTGTVTDTNLLYYTLSVAPLGSDAFVEVFRGTAPVTSGVLGRLDTAALANDTYTLRLFAIDAGGNRAFIDSTFSVRGELKLGNFTLSFTDLTLPVSGVPVTVSRTYDTLTAGTDNGLGFGWRLEYRDTDLRTSVPPSGEEEYGVYNPFRDGARVYVTLPGGRREGFTFQPQRLGGFGGLFAFYAPAFVADPGVTDRLSVPDNVTLIPSGRDYYALNDLPYNPADAANFAGRYTLTTKDGLVYTIDAVTGDLLAAADTHGNTLSFTDAAVTSSAGPRVTFERDPQGRITAAVDPAGKKVLYRYDARGDLVAVTDRTGSATQLVYRTDRPHYLDKVIDPLGRTGVRTEYDAQGRLVTLIDAAGKAVQLAHDPDHSVETVKDQFGNPTTYEYDGRGNVVTEVNALGGITRRTYDGANNLLSETDPLGRTTRYTYDGDGNVLTTTDPLGNVTRSTYFTITPGLFAQVRGARPVTLPETTTDPLGNTTTNTYDGAGNLASTTDALGNVTRYAYDAAGNQTSVTDAAGGVTRFEYDGAGRLTRQVDALGHATAYTYDADGNQLTATTTLTTPAGVRTLVTRTEYDADGRPTAVTDAEGGVTRTEYDAAGRTAATVDALGRRTEFRYDERGKLVETIFPDATPADLTDNPRAKAEYDAAGRTTARTDELGRRTELKYDALGRLTETVYPDATPADPADNPRTKTEYDAAGQVKAQIDERGNRTEFTYDTAGRQTAVKDALNQTSSTAYDAAGRRVSQTDALGHTTGFAYDAAGRLTRTLFADGTATTETYDALGRATARTDQLNRTTRYEYDALGRLTAVVDALGQRTEYGYDEAGDLVSQKDANAHVTRYEYDGLGRRTATVLPLGQRSATQYDAAGNVARSTDFNGAATAFAYDERNRLLRKDYPGGTSVSFTYTPTGQRASYTDARGVTRWAYDERGRLLSRTEPDGQSVRYAYDAAGNRTAVTTAAGTTAYTFDALNRTATVTDPASGVTRYTYDTAGNLTRTDLPNGTFETRQYDAVNHLLFVESRNPSGVIASFRYTLAATGRRDAVVEQDGRRVAYAYDALDRLTGEAITDAAAGNRTISYTYDPVGNRLTRADSAEGTTAYAYDANDRLLTETLGAAVTTYTYDANGNTLSRTKSASDRATYAWDAEDRLVGADVTDAAGTRHNDYRYDADGIRVASVVAGDETRYLIDQVQPFAQVLVEYKPSGLAVVSYVYGNDLISQDRGGAKSYYHVDGLGSTRALTNAAGAVTDRYVYDAFGRTIGQTGATANAYLFAGEQRDANVGLDYLRARYLSVGTGRFYGRDRFDGLVTSPLTLHRFMYAGGNPVGNVDPSGNLFLELAVAAIAYATVSLISPNVGFAGVKDPCDDVLAPANSADGLGAVERVLIAEAEIDNTNFKPGGDFGKALEALGAMIENRLQTPGYYNTKSIIGVVTYGDAFEGFSKYPVIRDDVKMRIEYFCTHSGDYDGNGVYGKGLAQVIDVAKRTVSGSVVDPFVSKGGTYFNWSSSPKYNPPDFDLPPHLQGKTPLNPAPLAGNDFYTQ